jgi:hypothetical protein
LQTTGTVRLLKAVLERQDVLSPTGDRLIPSAVPSGNELIKQMPEYYHGDRCGGRALSSDKFQMVQNWTAGCLVDLRDEIGARLLAVELSGADS